MKEIIFSYQLKKESSLHHALFVSFLQLIRPEVTACQVTEKLKTLYIRIIKL